MTTTRFGILAVIALCAFGGEARAQNVNATWNTSGSAWYTGSNWVGGSYPGLQGVAATNTNIATFTSTATGTQFGINMGTASLNLGAIVTDSTRSTSTLIGDSSLTAGSLRLYGATVNSVNNVILRNNGSGLLTLQATQTGVMGVVLSNATENVIVIDNSGGITISSVISGASKNLTLMGSGTGILTLSGANTYSGVTTISSGTLQFAKEVALYNNNTANWTASNIVVKSGATLALNVGGSGEFTTGDVTTLLTNLGGLGGSIASNNGLTAGSTIAFDTTNASGGNFTVSDNIANSTGAGGGAIGLTKLGSGTLTLSGTNSYTGGTTVSVGTLALGNATNTLANTGAVNVNGGTLSLGSNSDTVGAVTLSSGSITSSTGVLTGASYSLSSGSVSAGLAGSGINLAKSGSGTVLLSGTNTYTGTTAISGSGMLQFAKQVSLYNNTPASWTAAKITVNSGSTLALNVGGTGEFTSSNVDTIKAIGSASTGFKNGSILGLDTTNASGGNFTYNVHTRRTPFGRAVLPCVDGSVQATEAVTAMAA